MKNTPDLTPDAPYGYTKKGTPRKYPERPKTPEERETRQRENKKRYLLRHPERRKKSALDYYYRTAERQLKRQRERIDADHPGFLRKSREYYQQNKPSIAANAKHWRANHPEEGALAVNKRRAAKLQATPPWADFAAIKSVYAECFVVTETTGIKHVVDHIIPLRGKNVCGLNISWNMRIIERVANSKKCNKFYQSDALPVSEHFPISKCSDEELLDYLRKNNALHLLGDAYP